jgi:hypothetical protein
MMKIAAYKRLQRLEHFRLAFSVRQYVLAFWSFRAKAAF